MKKLLAILLALTLAVSLCAVCVFADDEADDNTVKAKNITFVSEDGVVNVVPQGGSDLTALIDGDTVAGASSFATKGIVLFCNTHATNAGEYPEFSLVVELEKAATITGAVISLYEEANSMIGVPANGQVTVSYSDDGEDYDLLGEVDLECLDSNNDWETSARTIQVETCDVNFDEIFSAKFVKFTFTYGDSPFDDAKVIWEWMGLSEISVKAEDGSTVVVDPSEEPSKEEPSKEEPKPGTTAKNAAAGKSYVVEGASADSYLDNGSKLTDGALPESASYSDPAIVGLVSSSDFYKENGFSQVTIDLGAETKLTGFAAYISNLKDAGVAAASSIIYEYSVDGTNFIEIGEGSYDVDIATEAGVTAKNTIDADVSARYVRVKFVAGEGVWMMVSEIEAYTTVSGGKPTTEPTSDSGIIALAVVASLAAAGAVIIKKSR
ncbi:MAG: discoidin domain-containing protein [Ruminococcus sp.]|nr:discoidin domain-containing protein [Ruminococcus sp.]